ncbi:MAG: hypothetical protein OEW36_11660, partial [Hylemonella sp.]|nr:hypothetical protein [Hylemonella sp.]
SLIADIESIGTPGNALEVDSANPGMGWLNAHAGRSLNVTETSGALHVGQVRALAGNVVLSVRDSGAAGEDLLLDGAARIEALSTAAGEGDILLRAGDDVLADPDSVLESGRHLVIHSGQGDTGNEDGQGTQILMRGVMASNEIEIAGERQDDRIELNPQSVSGHVRVLGDVEGGLGGDDVLVMNLLPSMVALRDRLDDSSSGLVRDSVDLDGRGGNDRYVIQTHGSAAARDYLVNVLDTGAKNDGNDTLEVEGSEGADVFLLRRVGAITEGASTPIDAHTPAFVALMRGTVDEIRNQTYAELERVNYDENINARLIVRGHAGDDTFAVDDNAALTTLDAGAGDDTVQIGQMYGDVRTLGNVAAGDEFATVETTSGYLSRGNSVALTAYGGTGNDRFTVYSNKAQTRLEGNDGNDEFVVRAFVLADSSGFSTEGETQALGGEGEDTVLYNINAPVDLDGGAGFDKVVVVGTEEDDNFVITEDGVFGAGLNVRYENMEMLDVDGMEGDDHFFVQSTRAGVVTTIIGGVGSDTFDVAGDVTEPIVSLDLEGRSGVINHAVSSEDLGYDNLLAPGIGLNVAGGSVAGQLVVNQSDGNTLVNEQGETVDSYTIALAAVPTQAVYVNVSAARSTQEEEDGTPAGDAMLVSADGVNFQRYLTLTVTDTNPTTVYVKAVDDLRQEGERVYVVSHSVHSDDTDFNLVAVQNVRVTVLDDDKPEIVLTSSGLGNLVLEGDGLTGIADTY